MPSPEADAGVLAIDALFDGLGTDRLSYSAACCRLDGGWLTMEVLVARSHDGSRWLAVDQAGACPDCSPVPVAAVQLPGFEPPPDHRPEQPLRLRGRLSYGFAVDGDGQASFLRLEQAEPASAGAAP